MIASRVLLLSNSMCSSEGGISVAAISQLIISLSLFFNLLALIESYRPDF